MVRRDLGERENASCGKVYTIPDYRSLYPGESEWLQWKTNPKFEGRITANAFFAANNRRQVVFSPTDHRLKRIPGELARAHCITCLKSLRSQSNSGLISRSM